MKPIKPERISDQVFEQLREHIFRGHFKPGQQLMTEREPAQTLGVSRPTIREAMDRLRVIAEQRRPHGKKEQHRARRHFERGAL